MLTNIEVDENTEALLVLKYPLFSTVRVTFIHNLIILLYKENISFEISYNGFSFYVNNVIISLQWNDGFLNSYYLYIRGNDICKNVKCDDEGLLEAVTFIKENIKETL